MEGDRAMLDIFEFKSCTKTETLLAVPGTDLKMPATVIHGAHPGEKILITSGIHAAEYVAIVAGMELARRLDPADITGTVIIIHPVNVSGLIRHTSLVPEDGKNLNSVYPGKPDGTTAEWIAWFITSELYLHIDCYIDLHGGCQCVFRRSRRCSCRCGYLRRRHRSA